MGGLRLAEATARVNTLVAHENDEFTLPNSCIEVSGSVRYYKLQDRDTPSLMPDKVIETSWEGYPTGRDQVLEWILAQPLSK